MGAGAPPGSHGRLRRGRSRRLHGSALVFQKNWVSKVKRVVVFSSHHSFSPFPIQEVFSSIVLYSMITLLLLVNVFQHVEKIIRVLRCWYYFESMLPKWVKDPSLTSHMDVVMWDGDVRCRHPAKTPWRGFESFGCWENTTHFLAVICRLVTKELSLESQLDTKLCARDRSKDSDDCFILLVERFYFVTAYIYTDYKVCI